MNSIIQAMIILKGSPKPIKARNIGLMCNPIRSLNTVIKYIHILRGEYGEDVILDDNGRSSRDSREKHYYFNHDYELNNQYYKLMTEENREALNNIIVSENTDITLPLHKTEVTHMECSSLSWNEMLTVSDYFRKSDTSSVFSIIKDGAIVADATYIDGSNYGEPVSVIPSRLINNLTY